MKKYSKKINQIILRYIAATAAVIPLKANPEIAFIFFCFMTLDLSGNKLIFFTAVTNL